MTKESTWTSTPKARARLAGGYRRRRINTEEKVKESTWTSTPKARARLADGI